MPPPVRRSDYIAAIHAAYPDLRIVRSRLNDEGLTSDILIVNDDLIFRFPRDEAGIATIERETALLERIRPFVTLPIPEPVYHRVTPRAVGQVFAGYRMLPGEPLWRETFATLADATTIRRLAYQLATFLRALHGIPPGDLADILPASDWHVTMSDLYAQFRDILFPHLSEFVRGRIAALFSAYLDDGRNFAFAPALIHGDFGLGNLLFDARAGSVTGVIDFGSAGLGDPAYDVAMLLAYGEPFARAGFAAYPAMEGMLPRARFYLRIVPLHEALFGIERDDPDAVERGIARFMEGDEAG